MTNKDGFHIQINMPDIIDLPSLPQLPQPNISAGQKFRVNNIIFIAANINGNWDWCEEKKPEDICKEKSTWVIEPNNEALSSCPELRNLCEKNSADADYDPQTIMMCEDDPAFGTMNIKVELVVGISDLFDTDTCSDSKAPCKEQGGSKSDNDPNTIKGFSRATLSQNAIKQFENWVLVIDQGKTDKVVTGESGSSTKQLKFPMEYPLSKIGTVIAAIIADPTKGGPCSNIACETYNSTRTAPIQLLSIDIPLYQSCKASTELTGQTLLKGVLYQAMSACNFSYGGNKVRENQLEALMSPGGSAPQEIKDKAALCKAALDKFNAHPCRGFLRPPSPPDPINPPAIIDNLQNLRVLCISKMKEILCDEVISTREEKNPVPVPTPTADGGTEYRSRININAYIKSTNNGAQECFKIPTSIEMSRDNDNIIFTVVAGHECKPDDEQYTKDKLTYALITTKAGYDWKSNDFEHDHELCKKEDVTCRKVSVNVKYKENAQGDCVLESPVNMTDIATGDTISQSNEQDLEVDVEIPRFNPKLATPVAYPGWLNKDYRYMAYRCKECNDDEIIKIIEKIKNDIRSTNGYCCVARVGKDQPYSDIDYISKDACCKIFASDDPSEVQRESIARQFFIPADKDTKAARDSAFQKCFPPVECCMPGIKNGGLCIYKPRFKPSVKFKVTTDIKLCSIDEKNNVCNQDKVSDTSVASDLGICKIKGRTQTYEIFNGNGDFNYDFLLSNKFGLADNNLRSELIRYRACEGKSSEATYCQNVKSKEILEQEIRNYAAGLGINQGNKLKKLLTKSQCQAEAGAMGSLLGLWEWNDINPQGPADSVRRSYKSSCKNLMDGPKTETVTVEVQLEDVPTSKNQLSSSDIINLLNNNNLKNIMRSEIIEAVGKSQTFETAVCSLVLDGGGIYGSELYGCMTLECCQALLEKEIKEKHPNYSDAQVEQLLGGLEYRPSRGSFLCDNYPGQTNPLEPKPPGSSLSPPVLDSDTDISNTVDAILADTNRYKITDIEVFPPKYTNKDVRAEYIPGVTPTEGNDQCKTKANEYLNTDNASSPKDYIFVPSYTKLDQVNVTVDSNENIVVDPTPPVPGSCGSMSSEESNIEGKFFSAESLCLKKGGKVVDNCDECGQDVSRPDFPPPDDPPPSPDPNDPKDPNDPSNPPATTAGKTKATLKVSIPIQNQQEAVSLNINLPIVVNGRTYKSLGVVRSSKIVLRAVVSSAAPNLTPDQLDSIIFVGLEEK